MPLVVRPARLTDIPAITDIYNHAGVASTASWHLKPVSVATQEAIYRHRRQHDQPTFVAELDDDLLGYSTYGSFRDMDGYARTAEHSIYVLAGHRGEGIGHKLMAPIIDHALDAGLHALVGALDGSNQTSIEFHRSVGFTEVGRLPQVGFKFGRWLDLVFVELILTPDLRSADD